MSENGRLIYIEKSEADCNDEAAINKPNNQQLIPKRYLNLDSPVLVSRPVKSSMKEIQGGYKKSGPVKASIPGTTKTKGSAKIPSLLHQSKPSYHPNGNATATH